MFWMHDPHHADFSCVFSLDLVILCVFRSLSLHRVNFPLVCFLSELTLIDIKIPCIVIPCCYINVVVVFHSKAKRNPHIKYALFSFKIEQRIKLRNSRQRSPHLCHSSSLTYSHSHTNLNLNRTKKRNARTYFIRAYKCKSIRSI